MKHRMSHKILLAGAVMALAGMLPFAASAHTDIRIGANLTGLVDALVGAPPPPPTVVYAPQPAYAYAEPQPVPVPPPVAYAYAPPPPPAPVYYAAPPAYPAFGLNVLLGNNGWHGGHWHHGHGRRGHWRH